MSTQPTGGPAFPIPGHHAGMTLRDYFAAQALGLIGGRAWDHVPGGDMAMIHTWAASAYIIADAMLRARTE